MLKSMTGYGAAERAGAHGNITVELRAVNNRYFDCNVRIPKLYLFAEEGIKAKVQAVTTRGKVDVFVTLDVSNTAGMQVDVNRPVAEAYRAALQELADGYDLKNDISVSLLTRFPDVLLTQKQPEDVDHISEDILEVLECALADFDRMRAREGARLEEDILQRTQRIEQMLALIEQRSPQIVADYRTKLEQRMAEVLSGTQIDANRILTEAAIFADKIAVDEETVRLRSHINQLRLMLKTGGAVGRKLDFLIQEFNREANTIGSKCNDLETTQHVVDIKAEIEKIREQIQNIE